MPETLPLIGYDNLLEQGTITAVNWTDEENAYDWLTYDVATSADNATCTIETDIGGAGASCNYLAIHGHTIGTVGIAVKLEYWTGAAYADVPQASVSPSDDSTIFITFPSVSATKFRLSLTTVGVAVTIAVVSFGEYLELERGCKSGFTPPTMSRVDRIMGLTSQGGQLLGRSLVRTGVTGAISLADMTEQWVRDNLDDFIEHTQEKGWFLQWNHADRPSETGYCWTTKTPQPTYSQPGFMSARIDYQGLTE